LSRIDKFEARNLPHLYIPVAPAIYEHLCKISFLILMITLINCTRKEDELINLIILEESYDGRLSLISILQDETLRVKFTLLFDPSTVVFHARKIMIIKYEND
jgi:hypothetical protein